MESDELHSCHLEKLDAVGVVSRGGRIAGRIRKTSVIPVKGLEPRLRKHFLKQRRVSSAGHVVVTDGDSIRHPAMELVHAAAGDRPLLSVVLVNDVAHLTDKNDLLPLQVGYDPVSPHLERGIDHRTLTIKFLAAVAGLVTIFGTAIILGIRNNNNAECSSGCWRQFVSLQWISRCKERNDSVQNRQNGDTAKDGQEEGLQ